MRTSYKAALLLTSGLGLIVSAPALAQSGASPQTVPSGTPPEGAPAGISPEATPASPAAEAGPQGGRTATGGNSEGGDIIVTARRVEERLQDVPISITVFNQQQISNRNIVAPEDLALYTPSLSTNGVTGRENTAYSIRGFTQEIGTSPSVAVYFADVVAPRSSSSIPQGDGAGPGSFFDLQNVQVLKGPQGTLFGRNTTGGAVLLVPQKPTGRFEGYVEGLYGSYDWKGLQGAINAPLTDTVRARLAFDFQDRDGLTKNVGTGPDLDDRHYIAVRGSVVWDVTPDIENYTIVSYLHSKSNGSGYALIGCNPASFIGANVCGPFATQQGGGPHTVSTDIGNPLNERTEYRGINTTTWQVSDTLTVKNIISYTRLTGKYVSDVFSSDIKIPTTVFVPVQSATGAVLGLQPTPTGALAGTRLQFVDTFANGDAGNTDQSTFTEELQFQGRIGGDKFIWQAGAYYERAAPHGYTENRSTQLVNCTDVTTLQCYSPLGQIFRRGYALFYSNLLGVPAQFTDPGYDFPIGGLGRRRTTVAYRNLGIYAQGTYALTDQLKVTGGIRYTSDEVKATANELSYAFGGPGFGANNPRVSCVQFDATITNDCLITSRTKSSKPTWLIDLDYKPNENILLYGKYARGYRQGSVTPSGAGIYRTFRPERIDAFEIGLKTDIRGALRGYFNIDGFYNNLYGQQINAAFTDTDNVVSQASGIINVNKSRSYGIEAEANITLFRGFNLNGSYTHLRTKLVSAPVIVPTPPFEIVTLSAAVGGDLAYSPRDRVTVTGSYALPLDPGLGQIVFGATYSYSSSQLAVSPASSPFAKMKSFNTLNLNLNWNRVGGSAFDVSVFATNVTDEKYQTQVAGIYNGTGLEFARYGEQRVIGGKLRFNF
ncbi:TonB-dependent receptor [uncultured Sphingomonas sp.]|uniref:TonB-dependent receptor n=1 Tax=uncultured Sphingomonas sp. TaxID=158754 RepID=UPI0035CC3970